MSKYPKYVRSPKWYIWYTKIIKKIGLGNFRGMSLYPFGIFVNSFDYWDMDKFVNHESIHWKQQKEMLVIPFYLWYLIELGINAIKYGKKAYKNLSFEQEAYDNDQNLDYLKTRKKFSWWKYLKYKPVK